MTSDQIKQKVQTRIVFLSIVLMAAKFLAFFLTNSIGILTDAMESIVNVTAGFIGLYSLYIAAKPKDESHPYGHGKVELISASIEGMLISGAGILIIYEGVRRIFEPSQIEKLDLGILLVALAGLINYIIGAYSIRQGKKYSSIALIAGGKHLQSDTYSSIGLVLGLVLLYATKIEWIDSALALIFGGIIFFTGTKILRETVANLMDKTDKTVLEAIRHAIDNNRRVDWIDVHNLRVIKYGNFFHIDCDLTLPWYYNINQGHHACEELTQALTRDFSAHVFFSIHMDPCQEAHCTHCQVVDCPHRKTPFVAPENLSIQELTKDDSERQNHP